MCNWRKYISRTLLLAYLYGVRINYYNYTIAASCKNRIVLTRWKIQENSPLIHSCSTIRYMKCDLRCSRSLLLAAHPPNDKCDYSWFSSLISGSTGIVIWKSRIRRMWSMITSSSLHKLCIKWRVRLFGLYSSHKIF